MIEMNPYMLSLTKHRVFATLLPELNNLPMESTRETGSMTVQQPAYARC